MGIFVFHGPLDMKLSRVSYITAAGRNGIYLGRLLVVAGLAELVCKATHQRSRNTARAVGKSDG